MALLDAHQDAVSHSRGGLCGLAVIAAQFVRRGEAWKRQV
jgi:hypothetical protein